jgi:hypothetical protein
MSQRQGSACLRTLAALVVAIGLVIGGLGLARAQTPPVDTRGLGSGPYAVMEAQLQVTFFRINVVELRIRFDEATAAEIERLARDQDHSEEREERLAQVAARAENALAVLRFQRDVRLSRFLREAREDLERAYEAGFIDAATLRTISAELPRSFEPIADRGFRDEDQLLYRVYPDRLRIILLDGDGRVLLDRTDEGHERRLALLGSYFAPGTEFREDLIRSVF